MRKKIPLEPVRETPKDWERVLKRIIELYKKELARPLLRLVTPQTNEPEPKTLTDAILSGRVTYERGRFKGQFNSSLSKELRAMGAKWDSRQGSFTLPRSQMPTHVSVALSHAKFKRDEIVGKVKQTLNKMTPDEIASDLNIDNLIDETLRRTDQRMRRSYRDLTVSPELTIEQRRMLTLEYTENLNRSVKGFFTREILDLKKRVETHTFAGYRYEQMASLIKTRYGVSETRAKTIARNETNQFLSKFKETRYKDAGVKEYRWKCVVGSANHPVRHFHKLNDNHIFSWDNPPVVNEEGDRKNPGEDYNCRCFAIPIISAHS